MLSLYQPFHNVEKVQHKNDTFETKNAKYWPFALNTVF